MSDEQQPNERERLPGEPLLWYRRYQRYKLIQPVRSIAAVFQEEEAERIAQLPEEKRGKARTEAPGQWYEGAKQWKWEMRATAWDEQQARELEKEIAAARARVLTSGYARMDRRIEDLDALASALRDEALDPNKRWLLDVKAIGTGPNAERVDLVTFNSDLIREFRATLTDIAAEMGERVKKSELSANVHATGGVSVYLPQKYALPEKYSLPEKVAITDEDEEDDDTEE